MNDKQRKILVTSGLLYANGDLHFGHMVECIQTDIWVRFQKMLGHECWYVCGDDAHGTPIMLKARKSNQDPVDMVMEFQKRHKEDLQSFDINIDFYHTTHSTENQYFVNKIYSTLCKNKDIEFKSIEQAYDATEQMFLPDRFVKGICPKCKASEQYGDSCEVCGATYTTSDLINPKSIVSNTTPIKKTTKHAFFKLSNYTKHLQQWLASGVVSSEISNKLKEWFDSGLQDWDISRDKPYFGFKIPGENDKYFYVWLDAPIGYMASFQKLCEQENLSFADFWNKDSKAELYHFIGKDITYFHTIFWPAILMASHYRTPSAVFIHGFLTLNGAKMSKSRGTFITARHYLKYLDKDYLRYYFATKLNSSIEDMDINLDDFVKKVNSDLVGKLVNIASRCSGFIQKYFQNTLSYEICDIKLWDSFVKQGDSLANHYEERNTSKALRIIMKMADQTNQLIDKEKPWVLIKSADTANRAQDICSFGLNVFRLLTFYLSPVIPSLYDNTLSFLKSKPIKWQNRKVYLQNHAINSYTPLIQRVDVQKVKTMLEDNKQVAELTINNKIKDTISYDDFAKLDLRIVQIISAEHVVEAKKLIKLKVDMGGEIRQVFAGIKAAYQPEDLVGKYTVMVANLAPRKMRFGVSEGMLILAVGDKQEELWLIEPQSGAMPGMQVQ